MINIRELRIGNILSFKGLWAAPVREFNNGVILFEGSKGVFATDIGIGPEKLTEDWVRRGGFKDGGQSSKIYRIFKISKSAHEGYDLHVGTAFNTITKEETGVNLKYVHQLQNLYFALTNNELTFSEKL